MPGFISIVLLTFVAQALPAQLSDTSFWSLISQLSEADRPYSSFFISNETSFQAGIPALVGRTHPGGAYLGVGAEQNFTYIAATRPDIGFIIDIRRDNMLEHLLYKAMFALSSNRNEFVSLLFSRKPPPGLYESSTAAELFDGYFHQPMDRQLINQNFQTMTKHLTQIRHFELTSKDLVAMERIYKALVYGFSAYSGLMKSKDREGKAWSYLASEENFQFVREMQRKNLIVPVVGDFAGPKAIRSIAKYLDDRNAKVMTFYTSNVEVSLFDASKAWQRFYSNVEELPLSGDSTFIRAVSPRPVRQDWDLTSYSMTDLVRAFKQGSITSFDQVILCCR